MTNELMTPSEVQEDQKIKNDLQKPAPDGQPASESHEPLFPGSEADGFRTRWHDIQGTFVDDPRQAVQKADELVVSATKRLAESFADERRKLEAVWAKGNDVSTEDLRQALRRYRSFFDRLLCV